MIGNRRKGKGKVVPVL